MRCSISENMLDILTGVRNQMPQSLGSSYPYSAFHPLDTVQVGTP